MAEFTVGKVDGATGATGQLSAAEWNQIAGLNNLITNSNQTPSTGDLQQLTKAVQNIGIAYASLIEGGGSAADTYVFDIQSNFTAPTLQNGMRFKGLTQFANTGASTINIASTGAKSIKKSDGTTDIDANDITGFFEIEYDSGNDVYILIQQSNSLYPKQITIANNSTDSDHDIDFTAGNFIFDDYTGQATVAALTKQIDATWSAGDNAGGLDTGAVANNTFYYCFAIYNPTTLASDFLFSTSSTSPTLPSGFTKKKYVGSILTDGSANIRLFYQNGNRFLLDTIITDHTPSPTSGAYATYTMSVPRLKNIIGLLSAGQTYTGTGVVGQNTRWRRTGSSNGGYIVSLGAVGGYFGRFNTFQPFMNSSAQVDVRFDFTAPSSGFEIKTEGWIDNNLQ